MFEHLGQPLLSRSEFLQRLFRSGLVALMLVSAWLGIGVLGYHLIARFNWVDSLLNASMIISGMGPVDALPSDAAKIFASFYAILSGVVFLSTAAILVAPALHRLMHHFHLQRGGEG
jgi:hypothetical protein